MHPWAGKGALGAPGAPARGGEEAEELEGLQRDRKAGLPAPPGPHPSLTHRRVRVPAAGGAAAEAALRAGSGAADPSDGCRCRPRRRRVSSRSPAPPPRCPARPRPRPHPAPGPRGQAGRALPDLRRRAPPTSPNVQWARRSGGRIRLQMGRTGNWGEWPREDAGRSRRKRATRVLRGRCHLQPPLGAHLDVRKELDTWGRGRN